ncbi:hypothetical protein N7523_002211 [Penicillium sp. IBT 18751x]|nr:hypothetical protein N7523_002211 [Penicillium sp. IBT 18751x]
MEDHVKCTKLRKRQPKQSINVFPRIAEWENLRGMADQVRIPHEVSVELFAWLRDILKAASEREFVTIRGMLPEEAYGFMEPDGIHKETYEYGRYSGPHFPVTLDRSASPTGNSGVDQVMKDHS